MFCLQAVKAFSRTRWVKQFVHTQKYRRVAALVAVFNIIGLLSINLMVFVVGLQGIGPLLSEMLWRPATAGAVLGALFCGVQLMFALRRLEERQAVVLQQQLRAEGFQIPQVVGGGDKGKEGHEVDIKAT
jgi:hypothetical protein